MTGFADNGTLTVADLAARRSDAIVFAGIGFRLAPGEGLILRGPNGAGKSTLLRCLAGLLKPAAGTVAWAPSETDAQDPEDRPGGWRPRAMHFVAHQTGLKPALGARTNLRFLAGLAGIRPARDALDAALAQVGLAHAPEVAAGRLSAGQQRRLSLARLLVAPRPLWLLDEPATALDADGQALVATLMTRHLEAGGSWIAATHQDIAVENVRTLTLTRAVFETEARAVPDGSGVPEALR